MGITTRTGDAGITSLYSGERVGKDTLLVDLYGTLDELCSFLGFARAIIRGRKVQELIEAVQRDLFAVGAGLSVPPKGRRRAPSSIGPAHVLMIEQLIAREEKRRSPTAGCFCLPGGSLAAATLDVSRALCRRAERLIVALKRRGRLENPSILVYMNRLSDLLYVLSRRFDRQHKKA